MNIKLENKIKRVLDDLSTTPSAILDSSAYHYIEKEMYSSYEEFMEVYNYLESLCEKDLSKDSYFPENRRYFFYKGKKLIWRKMWGQGTACQILEESKDWPDDWPMIFVDEKAVVIC